MTNSKLLPAIPQLPSGDLQVTADFFKKHLGFEISWLSQEHRLAILKRDETEIHFWKTNTIEDANNFGQVSSCYIRVKNIKQLFTEFKTNKTPFRYELTQQPWSMHEMQIDDPFGNAIKFGEPISK